MITNLYWGKFADVAIRKLVNPEKGKPLIVLADTTNDIQLAESLLNVRICSSATNSKNTAKTVNILAIYKSTPTSFVETERAK